jgi:phosphoserine phosphatase RsbU/P
VSDASRILIVDDEPDLELLIRQKFRREIRDGRYTFFFASNGREAMEKLREANGIEVVLSDINMPEMDGLTLLGQIRELNNPVLKAVIVSAYGDMENIRTAMNRGAFDFLTKPIDFSDLQITIDKTLEQLATLKSALASRDELVKIHRELDIAARIQKSLVPTKFPPFPGREEFEILADMIPAREVGGDFYDFFLLDESRLGFVIGDVSGKGVPAAIYMALCRALLRATALTAPGPDTCLARVNALLCEESSSGLFVTIAYGILDTRTGEVTYCLGGHNPPYVVRASEPARALESTKSPIVGLLPRATFSHRTLTLAPGDTLFLYTDGVTEAMDPRDDQYGEERLEAYLATAGGGSLREMLAGTVADVRAFASGAAQSDDLTMLALRYR